MAKKILVVDDDRGVLAVVKSLLHGNGYEVFEASDGDKGLELLFQHKPDLVILDVQMPKLNGYNFVFEMKKNDEVRDTPVIILTAKDAMAEMFEVEGVKEYIVKPFDNTDLLDRVKKHIR